MIHKRSLLAAACAAAFLGKAAPAAESLAEAVIQGDVILDWRVRYEGVDQAEFADSAAALTSRLRAGFRTAPLRNTSLLAEAVWVEALDDDYNSTTNGQTAYPVVPDPADFVAINRFALTNESLPGTTLTLGRQRIVHDDARFVGNVIWRQHEQTFDGLRAQLRPGKALTADVTYATQVNRVFGPDSPIGKWEGGMLLANVSRAFNWGRLSAIGYSLDLDDAAAMSSTTLGLKLTGSKPIGKVAATYTAAFARQEDAHANPADFAVSYSLLEGGVKLKKVGVAVGREVLGSNGSNAFSTPLATLHAFQGWADKFLATPAAGIVDEYLKVTYSLGARGPLKNLSAVGFFHRFDADAARSKYGDELDVSLIAEVARMTFTLKYASYSAKQLLTDTDKLWLSMDFAW
jgi:hypothetical protein